MKPDWEHKRLGIRLYRGDCLQVLPRLRAASVDAVITDPPYGSMKAAWDKKIDWPRFLMMIRRVAKEDSANLYFTAAKFTFDLARHMGADLRYDLIWDKVRSVGFLAAGRRPIRQHETILVASAKPRSWYNRLKIAIDGPFRKRMIVRKEETSSLYGTQPNRVGTFWTEDGTRCPSSILRFSKGPVHVHNLHHTQKPVELIEQLTRMYSNPRGLVLDPFMGSGTAGVACLRTGRRFIGIERDKKYFAAAVRRIEAEIANLSVRHLSAKPARRRPAAAAKRRQLATAS